LHGSQCFHHRNWQVPRAKGIQLGIQFHFIHNNLLGAVRAAQEARGQNGRQFSKND
jgi:hypothetical protein